MILHLSLFINIRFIDTIYCKFHTCIEYNKYCKIYNRYYNYHKSNCTKYIIVIFYLCTYYYNRYTVTRAYAIVSIVFAIILSCITDFISSSYVDCFILLPHKIIKIMSNNTNPNNLHSSKHLIWIDRFIV